MKLSQETAAKMAYGQNQEWQQLARGRRDINQIERQLRQPNQPCISRGVGGRKEEPQPRFEESREGRTFPIKEDSKKKGKASFGWNYNSYRSYYENKGLG